MGKNLVKSYPLRLDEELMDKLKVIAKKEDRNVREQITKIVRDYILKYEMQHGTINTNRAEHMLQVTQETIKSAENYKKKEIKISDDFNVNNILQASAYASKKTKIYETKKE